MRNIFKSKPLKVMKPKTPSQASLIRKQGRLNRIQAKQDAKVKNIQNKQQRKLNNIARKDAYKQDLQKQKDRVKLQQVEEKQKIKNIKKLKRAEAKKQSKVKKAEFKHKKWMAATGAGVGLAAIDQAPQIADKLNEDEHKGPEIVFGDYF